ncbi:hypothetical protein [Candidatus Pseudothioglobus sp. Uisw_016]|uniref:hypothetical protein n=1 Tax=Candidatus Pseudothioglobus sp. Uisw_016 TaxID=3230995 RepID=UPI003A85D41A
MFSKIKNKLFFLLFFLLISILVGLNKTSTQLIGINFKVTEYEIPLFLKIYNFYGRHFNYDSLVTQIIKNSQNDSDKVLQLSKWIINNIQKIPKGVDIVDSHPMTIIERRLGIEDQFADLLSVLIVYADIDSFFWNYKDNQLQSSLTFFKLSGKWSVIDPYYGIIFLNLEKVMASIDELKSENWKIVTLNMEPVNMENFKNIFNIKFDDIEQVREYYTKQFKQIPTQEIIDKISLFDLGGRSYTQSPLGRFKFALNGLKNRIF